ncbi:hypothetical protein CR513_37696, partial [Mucuna pruriens]
MGHEAAICTANIQPAAIEVKNAQKEEEDKLFVATCFPTTIHLLEKGFKLFLSGIPDLLLFLHCKFVTLQSQISNGRKSKKATTI